MQDFTAGAIHALPSKPRKSSGRAEIDEQIRDLVQAYGCTASCELIEQLVLTALKMSSDGINVADLKLFNRSLNELRYASRTFAPYRGKRKVCIFGSARTGASEPDFLAAHDFAARLVEHGYMVITGAGEGIMGAAQLGAGAADSFGLNIRLPFEQSANATIHGDPKLITFNYFFTRKLNFVKETHAIALFPGGFGTMDEGFEVLTLMQTGKARIIPLVMIDRPGGSYWKTWHAFLGEYLLKLGLVSAGDFHLYKMTDSVDVAIAEIAQFYRTFHSYRWVGQRLAIRIKSRLAGEAVEKLNTDFADILAGGRIEQGAALPQEQNEPELAALPRVILTPQRRNFGRFRQLIDAINAAELES